MRIHMTKGSSPLHLVKYLLDPHKQPNEQAPEIDTNMFGTTPEELAEEFRFAHTLNPRVKQTMAHFSLSLPPGERVQAEKRHAISQRLLTLTGHEDCQYISAEHFDQVHKHDVQHWHVGTSNVDLKGQHVEDDFLWLRLRTIEKQLEQEFDLQQVPDRSERDRRHIPTGEYRYKERTGVTLPREILWDKIEAHSADQPSMSVLTARLKTDGISVRFHQRDGQIKGISYELHDFACSGSKLGSAFTFPGLQKHLGVTHDSDQDAELLRLQALSTEQCQAWLQERVEKDQAIQVRRDYYRECYQHYAPQVNLRPEQKDLMVASRALQQGHSPEETLYILANGPYAQAIKQEQGKDQALTYAMTLTEQVAQQQQQTRSHQPDLER